MFSSRFRTRLQLEFEPRNRAAASRAATAMLVLSAGVTGLFAVVEPSTAGLLGVLVGFAVPATLGVLGFLAFRMPGRGPNTVWAAAPLVGVFLVAALDLATADASAAGQVFLCFPTLYAASQLRPRIAFAAMGFAVLADVVVAVWLLAPLRAATDVVYVGVTLVTMTVLLVRGGQQQDRLTAELRRQAAIDPLTGLVTRRVLDEAAQTALASAESGGGTVLILADLDHFKTVNDTWGHPVGDAALVHLAGILSAHSRPQDIVCRLGGDEMAMLLPGCSAESGRDRAEIIALAVRQQPLPTAAGPIDLSVSLGVAHATRDAVDLRALYAQADAVLYDAKRDGRGRVGRVLDEYRAAAAVAGRSSVGSPESSGDS